MDGEEYANTGASDSKFPEGFAKTLELLRTDSNLSSYWRNIWRVPKTSQEFEEYTADLYGFANFTGGLLGRSPCFLAAIVSSWAHSAEFFGEYSSAARKLHIECSKNKTVLTHAISDISLQGQVDATRQLRIVRRTADGIYVTGFKQLATLAPYADEILVYPYRALSAADADSALCFRVQRGSRGLYLHTRRGYRLASELEEESIDALDELDSIVEFRDCFVPWDRVLIAGNVERCNHLRAGTGMTLLAWTQALTRMTAKAQLYVQLAQSIISTRDTSAKEPQLLSIKLQRFARNTRQDLETAVGSAHWNGDYEAWLPEKGALLNGIANFTDGIEHATRVLGQVGGLDLICPRPEQAETPGIVPAVPGLTDWRIYSNLTSGSYGFRQTRYELAFVGDADRLSLTK